MQNSDSVSKKKSISMTFPQASLEEIASVGDGALDPFASHLYRAWQEGLPCGNTSPTRCVCQEGTHLNMGQIYSVSRLTASTGAPPKSYLVNPIRCQNLRTG